MRKCRTNDMNKVKRQAKEAGMLPMDVHTLQDRLKNKGKEELISELELLLGAKKLRTLQLVVMSPEYHDELVERMKG